MKSDYGLRVLLSLAEQARQAPEQPLSIRRLAEADGVPRRFLEHIMLDLKEKGLVRSLAGRDGGFVLGRQAGEITMGEVVRLFDSSLSPIACVSEHHPEDCPQAKTCRFRRVFLDIRVVTSSLMDRISLQDLLEDKIPRLGFDGFVHGDGI